MKLYNQGLLTLLISLFLLASCKVSNTDLLVDNNNGIQGSLVDTVSLYSKTVKSEASLTGGLSLYPLGFVVDPNFGTTNATISASVTTPVNNFSFGKEPVLDSAYLVLALSPNYYGDTTAQYSVEVRQLTNTLAQDANYKSDFVHAANSQIIGTYNGVIYPKTPRTVIKINANGSNDSTKLFPQIRIPIDKALASQLFLNASAANLATNLAFNNYFKGLQINIVNKQTSGDFGMFSINLVNSASSYSGVELSYKNKNAADNSKIDTIQTVFPISTNFSDIASTVTRNYDGSAIQNAFNTDFSTNQTAYIQPMDGSLMEIKSPSLNFLKDLGTVIINRAELILPTASGSDVLPYTPSPFLFITTLDKADQKALLADGQLIQTGSGFTSNPALGGIYNSTNKTYVFNITQHIQNLINDKVPSKNLYIGQTFPIVNTSSTSAAPSLTGIANTFSSANTSVISSNVDGMKLKIFYTVVNSK